MGADEEIRQWDFGGWRGPFHTQCIVNSKISMRDDGMPEISDAHRDAATVLNLGALVGEIIFNPPRALTVVSEPCVRSRG